MRGIPSKTKCVSLTSVTYYEGNYSKLKELSHQNPEILRFYIDNLSKGALRMLDKLNSLTLYEAKDRYLDLISKINNIEELIPLSEIATYLNITPIQMSRIRRELNIIN